MAIGVWGRGPCPPYEKLGSDVFSVFLAYSDRGYCAASSFFNSMVVLRCNPILVAMSSRSVNPNRLRRAAARILEASQLSAVQFGLPSQVKNEANHDHSKTHQLWLNL